ncbi:MAG: hypothetical protein JST92_04645 [Deltaproteobacteria bacterium]|nr:hypothetical protein [Deltaproteobacteria bacterium]
MPTKIRVLAVELEALRAGVKLRAGHELRLLVHGPGSPAITEEEREALAAEEEEADEGTHTPSSSEDARAGDEGGDAGGDFVETAKHLIHAVVTTIGDTVLQNHKVKIHSLETGEQVAEGTTDEQGVVTAEVPNEGTYRIEIVDEEMKLDGDGASTWDAEIPVTLVCRFVDAKGAPVVGEVVEATASGYTMKLTTDATGRVQAAALHEPYELKIRGQSFAAHAVPASDHDADDSATYVFVLEEKQS